MIVSRTLLVGLACVTAAFAANTNNQVNDIVDKLDMDAHDVIPVIADLVANETISATTLQGPMSSFISDWQEASSDLAAVPVSDGSNTTAPTNDDISVTYGDVLFAVASILSALEDDIPGLAGVIGPLDPAIANFTLQLNTTVVNSTNFDHIIMGDSRQWFTQKNFTQTLAALKLQPGITDTEHQVFHG